MSEHHHHNWDEIRPPGPVTPICTRCGHKLIEHRLYHDAPPPEMVGRLTEARFSGIETSGIYCPHLDMVEGEDYDD